MCCGHDTDRAIRDAGLRRTTPRATVAMALRHSGGHRTAEEIQAAIGREAGAAPVDRSTVYRALDALERAGLVATVRSPQAERRFEWAADHEHHHHLSCSRCGAEVTLPLASVAALRREVRAATGFDLSVRHLVLTGRCASCRADGEGHAS